MRRYGDESLEGSPLEILQELSGAMLERGVGGRGLASVVRDDPGWDNMECTRRHVALMWQELNEAVTAESGAALTRRLTDWDETWNPIIVVGEPDDFAEKWPADEPYGWLPLGKAHKREAGWPDSTAITAGETAGPRCALETDLTSVGSATIRCGFGGDVLGRARVELVVEDVGTLAVAPSSGRWPTHPLPNAEDRARLERLKAKLLTAGLRVHPDAHRNLVGDSGGVLTQHEYPTTGGLTLDLGHEVLINAPVDEWYCDQADHELRMEDGDLVIVDDHGRSHQVHRHIPLPGFLDATTSFGLVTETAFSHADRVRLSPIDGCAYRCDYCDMPSIPYTQHAVDALVAALSVALLDTELPPRHVMISGGSPRARHIEWFEAAILGVTAACPLPLDVMMSAIPGRPDVVDHLVDGGVVGFSINMELYSPDASELYIRGKHRHARPGYDEFVGRAVERLGRTGAVRSLIIAGLEPHAETIAGVRHIASLGADPVLSPFRPAERTALEQRRPPAADDMLRLLEEARAIVADAGVALGPQCIPCQHNTLTFPWDVRPEPV